MADVKLNPDSDDVGIAEQLKEIKESLSALEGGRVFDI